MRVTVAARPCLPAGRKPKPRITAIRGKRLTLTLTRPAPFERDIQAAILKLLALHPAVHRAWRVNSGAAAGEYVDRRGIAHRQFVQFHSQRGHSDLAGVLKGGRALFLECKRPGEKLTAVQRGFLEDMRAGGAFAACVHSVEEAAECLDRAAQACALWREVDSG